MGKDLHMNRQRHLTLIRHAKSAWDDPGLADFERPLNQRGQRDAPRVGRFLVQQGVSFDRMLCSTATRARQTLDGIRQSVEIDEGNIAYLDDLYLASPGMMKSVIAAHAANSRDVAIIAHNPGIETFAWELSNRRVERMPTCCVVRLSFSGDNCSWQQLLHQHATLELYVLAKEID